jgi:multiple sugar transport system substrate-binding protein
MQTFQAHNRIQLHVERTPWSEAWPKLLNFAIHGGAPDISQIGAIWTSSLVAMNVLRPFTPVEIAGLGGIEAFYTSVWQNTLVANSNSVWGIPFTAFAYILLYRRSLLQRAGIDEHTAFTSPAAVIETLQRLQAAGVAAPIVLPSGTPYRGRVHMAASWVWGAGGEFISPTGQQILFDQPAAYAGLEAFLSLYRYMAPADYNLPYDRCVQKVIRGEAALTITGSSVTTALTGHANPSDYADLGTALLPGIPWIGGSNLVVWRDTLMHPECERATLKLVQFLTHPATQKQYAEMAHALPARKDVVDTMQMQVSSLNATLARALISGRTYYPALIWMRILSDLSRAFDNITTNILSETAADINTLVAKQIDPLARRFNLMLGTST